MRVVLVSSNISDNCLGRALALADVLSLDHEVKIVGTRFGGRTWPPGEGHAVKIQWVEGLWWPAYASKLNRLVDLIDGDVAIAVKPLLPSYGAALRARRRTGIPIVLDNDDDEVALSPLPGVRSLPRAIFHPDGAFSRRYMQRSISRADARTVASRTLERRVGGHLVRHAKDTQRLQPSGTGPDRKWLCELGLGAGPIVLFLGTPRPWKGVQDAAAAVGRIPDASLVVVGLDSSPYSERVAALPRVHGVGPVSGSRVPEILGAADVVVIPQRSTAVTEVQVPSKLFDAMAMAKPIVATAVSDIPEILGEERGRVVPPGDVGALAAAIRELLQEPEKALGLGSAAREWCVEHASLHAARGPLNRAIEEALGNASCR